MIFLTVGTQLPFDRLVRAVDEWSAKHDATIVGQIGPSNYEPLNFEHRDFYTSSEMDKLIATADVVIAHAGIGSILSALTSSKPIIIMPRRAALGEHRNDHQVATAKKFASYSLVRAVFDVDELDSAIDQHSEAADIQPLPKFAPVELLSQIRALIHE